MLSAKDWPKFNFSLITLPSPLSEMLAEFEEEFVSQPHNSKELVWVSELGRVDLAINGVTSSFSEVEAAIVFILGRSFRPLTTLQLSEVSGVAVVTLSLVLGVLVRHQVLLFYDSNQSF